MFALEVYNLSRFTDTALCAQHYMCSDELLYRDIQWWNVSL